MSSKAKNGGENMDYTELVKELRLDHKWKDASRHYALMHEAADAIESLLAVKDEFKNAYHAEHDARIETIKFYQNKLCDWCGVCPENKRRPGDCEIIFPNDPIPEVCIEPPKEET